MLLAGVAAMTVTLGAGLAWLVTAYDFPARRLLDGCLFLPLAVPTYIVAYAYLDILHPVGPAQETLRWMLGYEGPREFRLPDIRSMAGCIGMLGFVLYPYVYLPTRALFAMQSASLLETGANARLDAPSGVHPDCAASGQAGDCLGAQPGAHGSVERYRSLGVSWSPYPDRLNLLDVGDTLGPGWRGADRARDAGRRPWTRDAGALGSTASALCERRAASAPDRSSPSGPGGRCGSDAHHLRSCCRRVRDPIRLSGRRRDRTSSAQRLAIVDIHLAAIDCHVCRVATAVACALGLAVAYSARRFGHRNAAGVVTLASIGYATPGTVVAIALLPTITGLDRMIDGASRTWQVSARASCS